MHDYLVTYDLNRPGQNYPQLYSAIQSVPHCHALESVWFVQHQGGATKIRDWLVQYIDHNDRLFVVRIDEWASRRLMNKCGDWLKE